MSLCAYRAGELLTEERLRAHLSLILRIENLGSILGSGASISAGGKQMKKVWADFRDYNVNEYKYLLDNGLVIPEEEGKETALVNFEALLDKLSISLYYNTEIVANETAASDIAKVIVALQKAVLLAAKLNDDYWFGKYDAGLTDYQTFLIRFCSNRQPGQPDPWIFTLNYDLGVEWAAESLGINVNNGFKGVHVRKFDSTTFDIGQRNTLSKGQAQFNLHGLNYIKLHGSLSWNVDEDGNLREYSSEAVYPKIKQFLDGTTNEFPSFQIYPSAAKFSQTVGYVYGELVRRLHEFVTKDQAAVIISGYSFGDSHINRILQAGLENPTLQMVVFHTDFDGTVASLANVPLLQMAYKNQLPNVTIVGQSEDVYFKNVAQLLPIPAILDQRKEDLKRMIRDLSTSAPVATQEGA